MYGNKQSLYQAVNVFLCAVKFHKFKTGVYGDWLTAEASAGR